MAYSRRNSVGEQQEARLQTEKITTICKQLSVTLDPINWQQHGMLAPVTVNNVEIASLLDLSQRDSDDILRQIQIKLFEQAALQSIHARPNVKALMWSPVDVVQPQPFLNLWIITLETGERIPIIESIKNGQRIYEPFALDADYETQLNTLFGPMSKGIYQLGEKVTIKERENQYVGEVLYIIPPGKVVPNRKNASRGYHTIAGTAYTNDVTARYIVACNDGFPHIVHQSQVIQ